jgi:hypothetical protein
VPVFDGASSRPSQAEAALLRDVLGAPRPPVTSLRSAARTYNQARRRTMVKRAVLVIFLLGSFLGSASLMSQQQPTRIAVETGAALDPIATGSIRQSCDRMRRRNECREAQPP